MKKILFSIVSILFAISAIAQSEHLSFKGVPIDGTLDQYVTKMKTAGFTYIGQQDGTAIMQGDFAGFKGCTIGVSTLKAVNVVSSIGVIFPSCNDWSTLEQNYNHLKAMLTEKYGSPSDVVEKFQNGNPRDNNSRLHELSMDRCTWYATYTTPKGDIQLSLKKEEYGKYFVLLKYYDKINTDTVRQQAMDDL